MLRKLVDSALSICAFFLASYSDEAIVFGCSGATSQTFTPASCTLLFSQLYSVYTTTPVEKTRQPSGKAPPSARTESRLDGEEIASPRGWRTLQWNYRTEHSFSSGTNLDLLSQTVRLHYRSHTEPLPVVHHQLMAVSRYACFISESLHYRRYFTPDILGAQN